MFATFEKESKLLAITVGDPSESADTIDLADGVYVICDSTGAPVSIEILDPEVGLDAKLELIANRQYDTDNTLALSSLTAAASAALAVPDHDVELTVTPITA